MNKRTGAIAGASAAVVAIAAILLPNAFASPDKPATPKALSPQDAANLGAAIAAALGQSAAGWYVDSGGKSDDKSADNSDDDGSDDNNVDVDVDVDGDSADEQTVIVNVLSKKAAKEVEAKGAVAKIVDNSMAELKSAAKTLRDNASIPGTAWSIDPKTNKLAVLADRTVTGAKMATLNKATGALGDMVTVKRSAGAFQPFDGNADAAAAAGGAADQGAADAGGAAGGDAGGAGAAAVDGGDAIFGGNVRCSLGFNVKLDGAPAFLTAGHCGNESQTWTADQAGAQALGTVADTKFPENDFAIVKLDDANADAPSTVDLQNGSTQEITQAADANVGMKVQRSGSTTGLKDGTVTGLDATVNYGNGDIVNGLIQTDVCAEGGDSGGPLFSGSSAIGLTSGGSGDCTQGGETFFQPVTAALQATGAQLGDGGAANGGAAAAGADGGDAAAGGAGGDAGSDNGGKANGGGKGNGGKADGGAADDGGAASAGAQDDGSAGES